MARVKEHAEKWAAEKGIIVTESQMIRELQAENEKLKDFSCNYARHTGNCDLHITGEKCTCGFNEARKKALKGNPNDR